MRFFLLMLVCAVMPFIVPPGPVSKPVAITLGVLLVIEALTWMWDSPKEEK